MLNKIMLKGGYGNGKGETAHEPGVYRTRRPR